MKKVDEYLELDEKLWERLLELTGGDVAVCYQCGECTAACPWGLVREKALPVRRLMRYAQLGVEHTDHAVVDVLERQPLVSTPVTARLLGGETGPAGL